MSMPLSARALPVWRSILFVPAVSDRFVDSALRQPADVLQIDLEDSVGPTQKDEARARVTGIAERFAQAGRDVIVRVNRPWRMLVRDLEAAVSPSVLAVSLPKVPDASFVLGVAEVLSELEFERGLPQGHTRIVAMIEDAQGLSAINEIAMAHPRMVGLIIGAEDLAVSMRMAVHEDGLTLPNLMAVMNEAFAPTDAELAHATAVVAAFDAQVGSRRAAFGFEGRMVDLPVVEQCRQVLQRAAAIKARA